MENCLTLIFLSSVIKLSTAGNVRLVDGSNSCAGRVEVYYNGEWGTVCDDFWALTNTAVVCRELGCDKISNIMRSAHFGPGSGKIWMDDVICNGSESSIFDCPKKEMGDHNCVHYEDVGVICSGIRLVGGSRCSGRLEILRDQTWMSVCDPVFDQQDAEVVCRELDCGAPVQVLGAAAFGKRDTQMWKQEIKCSGDEYQFALCPTSPSQFCSHENNVSVVCAETVRLVGGHSRCAGRVEVLHDGQWGTVRDLGWDLPDAAVCTGSEFTLTNCRFNGWGEGDNHAEDAGVICSDLSVSVTPASTISASLPPVSPSVSLPVLVIVLGVVLLLLLVPLLILIQQNRVMRRALSKRRHRTMSETVYEEIQHRQNHFTQRGRLISEELHSGYEEANELLQEEMKQITPGYYDDVITDGLKPDRETEGYQEEYDDVKNSNEDERNRLGSLISEALHSGYEDADELISEEMKQITPGYYDDVITDGLKPDRETEDGHESYDDIMMSEQNSDIKKEGDPEYDDVKNSNEDERNRLDYDDVGEESHKGGGAI